MDKQTVFIKRYPSKGELPSKKDYYFCLDQFSSNVMYFFDGRYMVDDTHNVINIEYWLEEIELPSEEEIYSESFKSDKTPKDFIKGANFILNKLK